MINLRILLVAIVCFLAGPGKASAQSLSFDGMLGQLEEYAEEYPQEKVYLHLDKPYYAAGDDIWFKAYVTIGQFNLLSGLSKILYVDLINRHEQVTQSLRLPLLGGVTVGDFKLADTLSEGNYRVRAYTNWMRNFEEELFFDRTFTVGNALADQVAVSTAFTIDNSPRQHEVDAHIQLADLEGAPLSGADVRYEVLLEGRSVNRGTATSDEQGGLEIQFVNKQPERRTGGHIDLFISPPGMPTVRKQVPIQHTGSDHSIQFFAEGGHLVAGTMSKVAFKALKPNGRAIGASGVLRNTAGEEVAVFETSYAGMGNLLFHPIAGEQYTAEVTFADGSTQEAPLPAVEASGYALSVNNENNQTIYVQLFATEDLVNGQTINMLLQRNGSVLYGSKIKLDKAQSLFSIPRQHLPTGVAQLTLFTDEMVPILERSLFQLNPADLLPLAIVPDQETYGPRQAVSLALEAGLPADTMRVAVLSASVINQGHVPDSALSGGILAELLLRSELKGYVENPGYYFEGDLAAGMEANRKRALDNLMLTQGWSRIDWQSLLAGQAPELVYQPEEELRVSGIVTRVGRKAPVPNATVTLLSTSAGAVGILDTITGPDGRFSFDRLLFLDSTDFVVQARDERGRKHLDITLDEVPRQSVTTNVNAPDVEVNVSSSMADYLTRSKAQYDELVQHGLRERAILIEAVEVKANPGAERRERLKHSSNLNGPGQADQVILSEELMSCSDLSVCLQGRLVGVIFRNGVPYSTRSPNTPMTVIMDGMEMGEDGLTMISPFDIDAIEVLRGIGNTAVYGSRGGGGVIIITTKRGTSGLSSRNAYTPGVVTHSPQGYYEVREFYAPDYAVADSLADVRDLRTTIHWEPHIVTDNEGKAQVKFYTADEPGVYRVVLEGLDIYGRIGRAIATIKIEGK